MAALDRITVDPAVMGGKACIRGMRVTVGTLVGLLTSGRSSDEMLRAYPYLEQEDVKQCRDYTASRLEDCDGSSTQHKTYCANHTPSGRQLGSLWR